MNKKNKILSAFALITLIIFFTGIVFAAEIPKEIQLSQKEWNFGKIQPGQKLTKELIITNNSQNPLEFSLIPTCDCLSVGPDKVKIAAKASASIIIFYDPKEDIGSIERYLLVKADIPGFDSAFFKVHGQVGEAVAEVAQVTAEPENQNYDVEILYYYVPNCSKCIKFINQTVPSLEKELNIKIKLNKKDIFDPKMYDEYKQRLSALKLKEKAYPALFLGKKVLQGEDEISKNIKTALKDYIKGGKEALPTLELTEPVENSKLAILPTIAAGLIDGINPCAFSTIIMLLTSLALAGKRRKEVLIIGIFFTLSVFVSYFMVGLGFFLTIQTATIFPIVGMIIKIVLVIILVAFAGLSFYDYALIKKGRTSEMILQLNDDFKKRIKDSIRNQVRSVALIGSSLVLGFLVSIFELGCTGQVYFPMIINMVRFKKEFYGFVLLLIYNLAFITPLIVVFILTYRGVSSKKVLEFFQKQMGRVKLSLAILFLILAVITIFM